MKRFAMMFAVAAVVFATLFASGCSDDNTPGPGKPGNTDKTEWERFTHAQLLKFKGGVKQARMFYTFAEEEAILKLDIAFDAQGRCTVYDPTGIEFSDESAVYGLATRDWGVASTRYTYSYDAAGRMIRVTRYEVGADPVVFVITYGGHNAFVIAPFPLGDITPFMLQGVASITSANYELICDGTTATQIAAVIGWPRSSIDETTWTYETTLPVKAETTTVSIQPDGSRGEVISRAETSYTYRKNWLNRVETTTTTILDEETSAVEKATTEFSAEWPCTPVFREISGNDPDLNFRIEFTYMDNGQPKSAKIVSGQSFTEEEFEQHYVDYDNAGNWIKAVRTLIQGEDKTEAYVERTLNYY